MITIIGSGYHGITRGGDTMSRQETMGLFTKLDHTMSSLVGIVSQLAAGQGQIIAFICNDSTRLD